MYISIKQRFWSSVNKRPNSVWLFAIIHISSILATFLTGIKVHDVIFIPHSILSTEEPWINQFNCQINTFKCRKWPHLSSSRSGNHGRGLSPSRALSPRRWTTSLVVTSASTTTGSPSSTCSGGSATDSSATQSMVWQLGVAGQSGPWRNNLT